MKNKGERHEYKGDPLSTAKSEGLKKATGLKAARLLAHKGPRNTVKLLLLTAPRNSRHLGRVYDPEDIVLEITLTAGAAMDALTKAVPVEARYTIGPRGHEIKEG